MSDIVNRVAQSSLVIFDLEEHYPEGQRMVLDIANWLYEGLILREKEFRILAAEHNWEEYRGGYVALHCSSDAVIPGWAYMLVGSKLQPHAKKTVIGDLEQLETALYQSALDSLDLSPFVNKPVIIKGCSQKPVPANAYLWACSKVQTVAKSVMYGEACSSVPLFKRK